MQINFTEAAGLLAFIPPACAAAIRYARTGKARGGERRDWAVIAGLHALLTLEIILSMRHRIDGLLGQWLRMDGVYSERRPAQAAALLIVVLLAAAAIRATLRHAPNRRLTIARGATAAVISLFVIEAVSLHAVDAILYRQVGLVMVIGWLWLACGCAAAAAALAPGRTR